MAFKISDFRRNPPEKMAISDIQILINKFDQRAKAYRSAIHIRNNENHLISYQDIYEKKQEMAKPRLINHTSSALKKMVNSKKDMIFITCTLNPNHNQDEKLLKQGYIQPKKILESRNYFNKFFDFIRHSSYAKQLRKKDKENLKVINSFSLEDYKNKKFDKSLFIKNRVHYFNMFEFTKKFNLHTHTPFFIPKSEKDTINFVKTILNARNNSEIGRIEILLPNHCLIHSIKHFKLCRSEINGGSYTLPSENKKSGNMAIFKLLKPKGKNNDYDVIVRYCMKYALKTKFDNDDNTSEKKQFIQNSLGLFRLLGINNYRTSLILVSKSLFNKFGYISLGGKGGKDSFYHFDRMFQDLVGFELDYKIESNGDVERLVIFSKRFGFEIDSYEQKKLRWT